MKNSKSTGNELQSQVRLDLALLDLLAIFGEFPDPFFSFRSVNLSFFVDHSLISTSAHKDCHELDCAL